MDLFRGPWMLLWIPIFLIAAVLLHLWACRRKTYWLAVLGRIETLARLYPAQASKRRRVQFLLSVCGISLLFFALAGPQWGIELVSSRASGLQVVVVIDTSLSMLTEDVAPNRMGRRRPN